MATSAYSVGDVLYSLEKAQKGVLEAMAVKEVIVVCNAATLGQTSFIYKDTLNSLWAERMLITKNEAIEIAQAVCNAQIQKLNDAIASLDC